MKKVIFTILFLLCAGLILGSDWKVLSDIKYTSGELLYVVNAKTGDLYSFLFNDTGIEETTLGTYKSTSFKYIVEHSVQLQIKKMDSSETFENIRQSKKLIDEERLQIWLVIAEFQKNKK